MTFYNDTKKKQSRVGADLVFIYHPFQFVFYIFLNLRCISIYLLN